MRVWYILRNDLNVHPDEWALAVAHGTDVIHIAQPHNYDLWVDPKGFNRDKRIMRVPLKTLEAIIAFLKRDQIGYSMIRNKIKGANVDMGLVIYPCAEGDLPKELHGKVG